MFLFDRALQLLTPKPNDDDEHTQEICVDGENCAHQEICEDSGKKICLECGRLLEENFISTYPFSAAGLKKRRKQEASSVYSDIPMYIQQDIKDMTIAIYERITKKSNKVVRNTLKKAIIMASLHRAAAITGNSISYYDLLDMFLLKQHEANKGFAVLSSNIPKDSQFIIEFNQAREERININAKLNKIGITNKSMFVRVMNVFTIVKEKSYIINASQPNSVICGCIYFWIVYSKIEKTSEEFSKIMGISKMTLLKVYVAVCDAVFKTILRSFFAILLKNCTPVLHNGPPKYKTLFKKKYDRLYGPDERMIVSNAFDPNTIKVEPRMSKQEITALPLDDVDNTLEWNILLNKYYYGLTSLYNLYVKIIKRNDKEMYFDFTEYDSVNGVDGMCLLREHLTSYFDTEK